MRNEWIHSDQLYNWSAHEPLHARFAPSAPNVDQTGGSPRAPRSPWLSHRALQTVRQPGLQMPARRGARAKILPFGEPSRWPAGDGLRPGGIFQTGLRILAELPAGASGAGKDLQYQPRVVKAKSEVLGSNAHGASNLIPARSRLSWDPRRQYFAELVASRLCLTHRNSKSRDLP